MFTWKISRKNFYVISMKNFYFHVHFKVWRWVVRLETMRESWRLHCVTIGPPGGLGGVYSTVIVKSMTHILGCVVDWEKTTDEPIFNGSWESQPTNGSQRILTQYQKLLLGVQTVNLFWPGLFTHTIHTCISVSHGSKLLPPKRRRVQETYLTIIKSRHCLWRSTPSYSWVCHINPPPHPQSFRSLPQSRLWPVRSRSRLHHPHHLPCLLTILPFSGLLL